MNLKNHFLVAMPSLDDDLFQRSVIYVCEHNEDGAMGIIINKTHEELTTCTVLSRLDIYPDAALQHSNYLQQPVLIGGPLAQDQGFIIHTPYPNLLSSIELSDELMMSISLDALKLMVSVDKPKYAIIALGYSGWGQGQLEKEIINNDWLVSKADPAILINTPIEYRWSMAAKALGINIATISTQQAVVQ